MDSSTIQQVISWVQENVGERTSKRELMQKAQGSSLPGEAKAALQDLPEGEHTKETVISSLKDKLMAGVGGMGGGRGGSGGGVGGMLGG